MLYIVSNCNTFRFNYFTLISYNSTTQTSWSLLHLNLQSISSTKEYALKRLRAHLSLSVKVGSRSLNDLNLCVNYCNCFCNCLPQPKSTYCRG